jgi:hypothetical protein
VRKLSAANLAPNPAGPVAQDHPGWRWGRPVAAWDGLQSSHPVAYPSRGRLAGHVDVLSAVTHDIPIVVVLVWIYNVAMEFCETLIEPGHPTLLPLGQVREVSVGHLPMPDNAR